MYVCIYVEREREREREREKAGGSPKRCRNPHAPTQVDGNHSALAELAAGGADVNWRHPSWRLASPLHKAAQLGHAQVVDGCGCVGVGRWEGGREVGAAGADAQPPSLGRSSTITVIRTISACVGDICDGRG